ncbi:MAG: CHAT domain-containing protein, partial [Bacteroidota bacterium]
PDGNLWYVPFSALLTADPSPQPVSSAQPYLIRDRQVRYLFSGRIALLHQQRRMNGQSRGDGALSMSPLNNQSIAGYPRLPSGEKTAKLFRRLVGDNHGHFFNDSSATKAIFRQYAHNVKLLHINTHTEINEEHPEESFLLFYTENAQVDGHLYRLTAEEIFDLELRADLAVLSACRTAGGQLYRGQGVANLARAFAYAGCSNLLVNLWEARDVTSNELLTLYYPAILQEGKGKSSALADAQRSYLENYPSSAHPGFWATTIVIGNDLPLKIRTNYSSIWLTVSGIMILLGGLGLRRARGRN